MWASILTNYIQHRDPSLNSTELVLPVSPRQKAVWTGPECCLHFTSVQLLCPSNTMPNTLAVSSFVLQSTDAFRNAVWTSYVPLDLLRIFNLKILRILGDSSSTCRGNYRHFSASLLAKADPLRLLWETHCIKLCLGCTVMVFYL